MTRFLPLALLAFAAVGRAQPDAPFRVAPVLADSNSSIALSPVSPPVLPLLGHPAVQQELGLSARQTADAIVLNQITGLSPAFWEAASLGRINTDLARVIVTERAATFLDTGLTKAQRTRLDQIAYQLREREFGAHAAFAMAARDLRLRPDQLADIEVLRGLRVEEIARHATSGERFEKVKDRVATTNGDTYEKMAEMLTRAQRERLSELRGRPFAGRVELIPAEAPKAAPKVPLPARVKAPKQELPPGVRLLIDRYPSRLFGVYDLELRYLANREVRAELKIDAEQARKLDAAYQSWSKAHLELSGLDLDRSGKLHDQTAKAIDEILQPAQKERFGQIMMRRRLLLGPEAMCGHPAAVAVLKLSPIQLRQLWEGSPLGDVLTRDQVTSLDRIVGEPFGLPVDIVDPLFARERPRPAPPARMGAALPRRPGSPFAFAHDFLHIAGALELSAEQIKKLRELAEDEPKITDLINRELSLTDTPPVVGAGRGLTPVGRVMDRYKAAVDQQCWNVLDPQQQSTARKLFGGKR